MSTRILVAAASFALGATLLVAPANAAPSTVAAAAPAQFKAAPIDWGKCKDDFLIDSGARCGMLTVPLDHADPTGPTIKLAVSRVKHKGQKYNGVMFTNPGGPGGSGTWVAGYGQFVPKDVGKTYDWIGLDPRGVGESRPALSCDKRILKIGTRPPYDPTTDDIRDRWIAKAEGYARDCGESASARLLPHMKTTDIVADFEVLRESLRAGKVSFYGFSYGTYIAQVYATLHPERLDKLVLDGVVDPRGIWYESNQSQNVAFEKSISKFFRWAAKGNRDLHLGRTAAAVEKTYYRVLRRLARNPINGVGAADLSDIALGAGYAAFLYPEVASAISEIANEGTAKQARMLYVSQNPVVPRGDNGYAAYLATICTDAPWPTDLNKILADNAAQDVRYPFITWGNGWFNAPCRTWPAAPAPAAVEVAPYAGSVLLINETFDGATPISGAREVRRRFTHAVLIEGVNGTTHSGSLSGVGCVDNKIAKYLASGKLPDRRAGDVSDIRCPRVPAPPTGLPGAQHRVEANFHTTPRLG
ncbi:MAG: peptidase [Nocardioides sp.]|jgi:pimeloyl-ACP methyl ester carboxylesterase|uniref:alpha/beta fold hydrolase n=1 Tax=Nocardioides sp. TaxID=35761 RepID=UPI002617484D|nr:alpha/beta fold hydrolase [Nocardioides sp.]MCW2833622.1 peptidase [Nocardioides sp.]